MRTELGQAIFSIRKQYLLCFTQKNMFTLWHYLHKQKEVSASILSKV